MNRAISSQRSPDRFTATHADAIGDLLNVAFVQAAAPLAQLLDHRVVLQAPSVNLIVADGLEHWLRHNLGDIQRVHVLRQAFGPDLSGEAVLVLPAKQTQAVVDLLEGPQAPAEPCYKRGAILELANILVGACIGQFSQALDVRTTYSPPKIDSFDQSTHHLQFSLSPDMQLALAAHAGFAIESAGFSGFIFLLMPDESVEWLLRTVGDTP
jgi:chemotaxis protein CheC